MIAQTPTRIQDLPPPGRFPGLSLAQAMRWSAVGMTKFFTGRGGEKTTAVPTSNRVFVNETGYILGEVGCVERTVRISVYPSVVPLTADFTLL